MLYAPIIQNWIMFAASSKEEHQKYHGFVRVTVNSLWLIWQTPIQPFDTPYYIDKKWNTVTETPCHNDSNCSFYLPCQMMKVFANIWNKTKRTDDCGWSSSLGIRSLAYYEMLLRIFYLNWLRTESSCRLSLHVNESSENVLTSRISLTFSRTLFNGVH